MFSMTVEDRYQQAQSLTLATKLCSLHGKGKCFVKCGWFNPSGILDFRYGGDNKGKGMVVNDS